MGVTKIEWCHYTFNHVRGCTKVSEGCANCYAATMSKRNPYVLGVWGDNGTRVVASEATWKEPVKWNKAAKEAGERHRVFCASLADVFEDWGGRMSDSRGLAGAIFDHDGSWGWGPDSAYDPWDNNTQNARAMTMDDVRRRLFDLIDNTPNLDWLLLTKRPENIMRLWPPLANSNMTVPLREILIRRNVWLGVSVENQEQADKRIPLLLQVPAKVRFLSCEPLLGPVDLHHLWHGDCWRGPCSHMEGRRGKPMIDWVIVGGESGHGARPMHTDWARSLRDQCQAAGVPFFFKQWGEYLPFCQWRKDLPLRPLESGPHTLVPSTAKNGTTQGVISAYRVGKKAAGRLLDGREWNEFPTYLRSKSSE